MEQIWRTHDTKKIRKLIWEEGGGWGWEGGEREKEAQCTDCSKGRIQKSILVTFNMLDLELDLYFSLSASQKALRGFLLVFAPLSFALFLSLFGTGALFFSALNLRALTFLFLSPLSLGAWILTGSLASIYSTSAFTLKYSLEGRSPELYVFTFSETTEEIAVRRHGGQNTIKLDLTVSLSVAPQPVLPFLSLLFFCFLSLVLHPSKYTCLNAYKGYWMYANPLGRRE